MAKLVEYTAIRRVIAELEPRQVYDFSETDNYYFETNDNPVPYDSAITLVASTYQRILTTTGSPSYDGVRIFGLANLIGVFAKSDGSLSIWDSTSGGGWVHHTTLADGLRSRRSTR